jgi:hypothetical protein
MKKLNNFKSSEIKSEAANKVKGGVFCEWYISQRGENGKANNAGLLMTNVDGVMVTNGNENFA